MARRNASKPLKGSSPNPDSETRHAGPQVAGGASSAEDAGREPYGQILDSVGKGYFESDLQGTLTFASPALARVLGLAEQDLRGQSLYGLLPKEAAGALRQALEHVLLTGKSAPVISCPVSRGGGPIEQLEFSAILSWDERDSPRGFRGLVRDVTDREQAQAMARATLDSQFNQLCILDELGVVRVVNRAWETAARAETSGVGADVGGNYLRALEQLSQLGISDAAIELEGVKAILDGRRKEFSFEYKKTNEVRSRWFLLTATPLVIGDKLSGAVLSRLDTTERKLAEEELTTLYKAMDSSIEGLALLSPEGASLFMNPAFAHLHGYDAPVELAGRHWGDLYPPEELVRLESTVMPQLKRLGYWSGEMRGLLRNGGTYDEEVSFTLIEKGQVIISSARDVTERKLAELELKRKDTLLESMAEATRELLVTRDFPKAMEKALELLGTAVEADRAYLYQIHPHGAAGEPVLGLRFEWTSGRTAPRQGTPDVQAIPMTHPLARLWKPVLERGGAVRQVVRDLPEADRSILSGSGVRSLMVLPVHCSGELWGCVGFSDCTIDREWSRNEQSILGAFAAAVGGALQRTEDEERLRRSEERLRIQVEGSRGFYYYLCDRDMNYTYISSPNFEEITGYSIEQVTGPHPSIVTDDPVNAVGDEWTRRVLEEGVEPPPYLYEIFHRDGHRVMLEVYERPLIEGGRVVGLQGVAQDVTERIRMEQRLRESEERLRFLVENMPGTFFYIQNTDGTYAYISPSVEAITGYTPEFIMGLRESLSTNNPVNIEAQKITDRVLKEGYAPPPYQYEMRHRDGRPRMLEAYERPILKDGKVVCALGLLHDITDRLTLQAKLEHYRHAEVMDHLSQGLAHEVRNPLFAINVTMEALQKKLAGQLEVEPYVKVVLEQTRRLANLIRDVLDLGRRSDPSHREVRQLEALAQEAADVLEENGAGSSDRLIIVPPPAPIVVRVEGSRIVEALANMIENALTFSPPETRVRVTFDVLKESVVARVSDEGPGLSPEMLPILFQPFATSRREGTGLGLAVVDRIARDHGGEVWAENHTDRPGCTFSFSLPLGDRE